MEQPHSIRSIFPAKDYRAYRLLFATGSILLYVIIFFFLHYTHPFPGLPIVAIIPVMVLIISIILIKEKLTIAKSIGIVLGAMGAIITIVYGKELSSALCALLLLQI